MPIYQLLVLDKQYNNCKGIWNYQCCMTAETIDIISKLQALWKCQNLSQDNRYIGCSKLAGWPKIFWKDVSENIKKTIFSISAYINKGPYYIYLIKINVS